MEQAQKITLVFCFGCLIAGLLKAVWPENGMKPVINAVLTLYILASVLHCVSGADLGALRQAVLALPQQSVQPVDFDAYLQSSYQTQLVQTAALLLEQSGISAQAALGEDGVCLITLDDPRQRAQAEALLAQSLQSGECRITVKGGEDDGG